MIYCEVCEMEVEDCACKGGPTAEWPEEDERPVHHVGADVYAPSACGLPMTSVGRTVSQKWPDVTCHRCLETRKKAMANVVHHIHLTGLSKPAYATACGAPLQYPMSSHNWELVTCEACLARRKNKPKAEPPTEPWVIEPPVKKQIRCSATTGGCGALIGYTRTMVKRSRGLTAEKPKPGYRAGDLFLRCPVCEARILVEAS